MSTLPTAFVNELISLLMSFATSLTALPAPAVASSSAAAFFGYTTVFFCYFPISLASGAFFVSVKHVTSCFSFFYGACFGCCFG